MKRTTWFTMCLLILGSTGCPRDKYRVAMRLEDSGQVRREVTLWIQDDNGVSPPKDDVLQAAKGVYGESKELDDKKLHFTGTFPDKLPADLLYAGHTNAGQVAESKNPLGTVHSYFESMPGERDMLKILKQIEALADTMSKCWVAWVKSEPTFEKDPPRREKLIRFLEGEFRDDLMSAMLMGWQAVIRIDAVREQNLDKGVWEERLMRGESYRFIAHFVEHGYLTLGEAELAMYGPEEPVVEPVIRKVAAVMGYESESELPAVLTSLRDKDKLEAAFNAGLQAIGSDKEKLQADFDALLPASMMDNADFDVEWHLPSPPVETNGEWNAEAGVLSWSMNGRGGCETPQMLYAVWAAPDETVQKQRFGSVVLDGERLRDYVVWFDGLKPAQREDWNGCLERVKPEEDWKAALRKFRFQPDAAQPTTQPAATQPAQPDGPVQGAVLILNEKPAE